MLLKEKKIVKIVVREISVNPLIVKLQKDVSDLRKDVSDIKETLHRYGLMLEDINDRFGRFLEGYEYLWKNSEKTIEHEKVIGATREDICVTQAALKSHVKNRKIHLVSKKGEER